MFDPPPPRVVFLVVNDACNLRCRSCDVGTGAPGMFRDRMRPASPRRLGLDDFRRLVDECRPFRPTIAATSVEPLLFDGLPDLVAHAVAAGCPTQVTTNGLLLPDRAADLAAAGLDALWVSLDGPPAVHDALRAGAATGKAGGAAPAPPLEGPRPSRPPVSRSAPSSVATATEEGAGKANGVWGRGLKRGAGVEPPLFPVDAPFARAVEGIRRFAAAARARERGSAVHVNAVVQPGNEGRLVELARELSALPIRSLVVSHLNFVTAEMARRHGEAAGGRYPARESCVAGLDPAAVDVWALDRELVRLRSTRFPFVVTESPALSGVALAAYYRNHASPAGRGACLAPWTVAQVLADGGVTGSTRCLDAVVGDVLDEPLMAVWRGGRMRAFRRFLRGRPLLPACARCCAAM